MNPARQTDRPVATDEPADSVFAGKSALVLLFSYYLMDPRPRRAAEALAQRGMDVEVLCLRGDGEPAREKVNGVSITRLPVRHRRGGRLGYVWQYFAFVTLTFLGVAWRSLRRRPALVHVHNMPDVLVFSALPAKLRGARVILDLHDPMPELMTTIYSIAGDGLPMALIRRFESASIHFADKVLTVNMACKKLFSARGCPPEKIRVVMNSPDEAIFKRRGFSSPLSRPATEDRAFTLMYHGAIVERHGLDLAVEAVRLASSGIPRLQLLIYGRQTAFLDQVLGSLDEQDRQRIIYLGPQSLTQIVEAIRGCDAGVIPNRRSVFTELNTPTRIFEYLSQGKPVVAPRSAGILDYFGPDELFYFDLGDAAALAWQLVNIYNHPEQVRLMVERGQRVHQRHNWASEKTGFIRTVAELLGGGSNSHHSQPDRTIGAVELSS